MQCKMKEYFFSFYTAEVQAILFSRVRIFLPFLDPERETRLLKNARRETRLLKNAPMLGKENCYKYFRISLKMSNFTSNNTL